MLTSVQLAALDRDGFVAPLAFCSPAAMAELRLSVDAAVGTPGPFGRDPWAARHQDCPAILAMCASTAICDAVAQVLGPSLVVWNSVLMNKAPGDGEIPWHQDHDFHYLDPDVGLAVWLAIDDAATANGCLEVIPGSHQAMLPFIARTTAGEFDSHVPDDQVAGHSRVPVELRAGEFLLFRNKILHRSRPNPSGRRRLGLAIRYTTPSVRVDARKFFDGYRVMPVRGAG
ncbi:MAG TPA: phytanoyl-CoA dioxygenase family protein [Trebonia sp.]|nr:phytanoyl-CoA dioxygenase family protein [Trebonia sp.]